MTVSSEAAINLFIAPQPAARVEVLAGGPPGKRGLPGEGANGSLIRGVGLFITSYDATNITLYGSGAVLPRSELAGRPVLVTEGEDLGLRTVTSSGPLTAGGPLSPGDLVVSAASGVGGYAALATTSDGSTVDGVAIMATADELAAFAADLSGLHSSLSDQIAAVASDLVALDASTAADLAAVRTELTRQAEDAYATARAAAYDGPVLNLCAGEGGDHASNAWTIPAPGDFTTGVWMKFDLIPRAVNDGIDHVEGDEVYSELATRMREGDGGFGDLFELALLRKVINGRWKLYPYFEASPDGSPTDDYKVNVRNATNPWGVLEDSRVTIAVWVQFDDEGESVARWFRQVHTTPGDIVLQGTEWVTLYEKRDIPTSIESAYTDPWGFGYDFGAVDVIAGEVRDVGPEGDLMAAPDAAAAIAEDPAGLTAYTDAAGNLHTPGPLAKATGPAGFATETYVDTAVANHVAAGDPHGDRAYTDGLIADVDAELANKAASSHTHTAADITSGTIAIARLPVGTGSSHVAAGDDARLADVWDRIVPAAMLLKANGGGGTVSPNINSSRWLGQYLDCTSVSGTWTEFYAPRDAGTYTLLVYGDKLAANGEATLTINGSTIGTVNQYNSSTVVGTIWPITGIVFASNAQHVLRCTNTGNGGGSSFGQRWSAFAWIRTA